MGNRRIVKVEEEEEDVVVQFNGLMSGNEDIRSRMSACKFFMIDQEQPVIQVGNQIFRGSLEPILGTAVCFQESGSITTDTDKNESSQRKTLSFVSKTDKVLVMKRVFLHPKNSPTRGERTATSSSGGAENVSE